MRLNSYKNQILELFRSNHLLSLEQIHGNISEAHFASIYRNVESLCNANVLKKVVISKNNVFYELASHNHAHFVCDGCEVVQEYDLPKEYLQSRTIGLVSDVMIRGKCLGCATIK